MIPETSAKPPPVVPKVQDIALQPGTTLMNGQYTIEKFLSSGGFGITYLARDSLDRQVVIKECYPEALCARSRGNVMARTTAYSGEFDSMIGMFVREARNLAQLRHPHIVGVHQVFESFGTAYMALDLVDGQDLLSIVTTKSMALSPGKIKKLLLKLLDAVATVHDNDMLHRDISPDNVLVDVWGNPVLIDFGAAREQASKKSRAVSQMMVVKDGYSPQEFYISGSRQRPCSDLYSLAATFYHIITGEAPVDSQTRLASIAAKRPDLCPPLNGRIEGFAPEFLEAIDRAMAVFADDRIQSAREWVTMIDVEKRRAATKQANMDAVNLQQVIAEMVVEVEESIARSIATEEKVSVTPAVEPAPKVLEYLTPIEGIEEAVAPAPKTPNGPTLAKGILCFLYDSMPRRPLAMAVFLAALTFHLLESPDNNVATVAGPEIQKLIALGRDVSAKTSELITAAL